MKPTVSRSRRVCYTELYRGTQRTYAVSVYKLHHVFFRLAFHESLSTVGRQLVFECRCTVRERDSEINYILQQIYELQAVSYNIYDIKFVMNETAYRLHLVKFVVEIQRSEPTNHRNGRRSALYTG